MWWYVYMLASKKNGTLYIWVTNDIKRRIYEHKEWINKWFTKHYNVKRLVHYEVFDRIYDAITREKQLKKWNRAWKMELIEKNNPNREDLYTRIE
jgi:putative endonuclease